MNSCGVAMKFRLPTWAKNKMTFTQPDTPEDSLVARFLNWSMKGFGIAKTAKAAR